MRIAQVLLTAFPLTILAAMAAERSALLALGAFPDSGTTWMLWLNLHSAFGRIWQASETVIGGLASAHLIALAVAAAIVLAAASSRRWPSYVFLTNHAALILAVVFSLMGTQSKVTSLGAGFLSPDHWALIWATDISGLQICMLVAGVTSCLACHVAVLRSNNRAETVAFRIRCLQQNL